MGDGTTNGFGLLICTDSYKTEDVVRLINVLIIKFRLECRFRYHRPSQPRIYIRERSMPNLRKLVTPHMDKSMLYKIERAAKSERVKKLK